MRRPVFYMTSWALSSAAMGSWCDPLVAERQAEVAEAARQWVHIQSEQFERYLMNNVSPDGLPPGVVIASPSRQAPNYYYVWVRDSSLVMAHLTKRMNQEADPGKRQILMNHLRGFVEFTRKVQGVKTRSGHFGEPKFHVDGTSFNEEWGRPQNDGPALRATTLMQFAKQLLASGDRKYVEQRLYDGKLPTGSAIKADLEFVSHHWKDKSYDLWEEVVGTHFYTLMVQRRALADGADFAATMGDKGASDWYRSQAREISEVINKMWNEERGVIEATSRGPGEQSYGKESNLDAAVLLASLHAAGGDNFFHPGDSRILSTAATMEEGFRKLFPINKAGKSGAAIGRYFEDHWDGRQRGGRGNPWIITTAGFADVYLKAANYFQEQGRIKVDKHNQKFFNLVLERSPVKVTEGMDLTVDNPLYGQLLAAIRTHAGMMVARIREHTIADGSLPEQMDGVTGEPIGARHLTWSYESVLAIGDH